MIDNTVWNEQADTLLCYFYGNIKIYNWSKIAKQLNQRLGTQFTDIDCRNRYEQINGPVHRTNWTPEEEREMHRLHNQNGNKWTVIARNLLGRNENCVKNYFYSKLRKSLRAINKIAKLHFKKSVKEVNNIVLYKLTEATDESLKQSPDISKEILGLSLDIKNRLLEYDIDQKNIRSRVDYRFERDLLLDLSEFNKSYKKKLKKEKKTITGSIIKKRRQPRKEVKPPQQQFESEESSKHQESVVDQEISVNSQRESIRRIAVNFVIKAPTQQEKEESQHSPIKNKQNTDSVLNVQNILRAQGVLEQRENKLARNFFMKEHLNRSFSSVRSLRSESSIPDMFGEDSLLNQGFKEFSQMEYDSQNQQIFNSHSQTSKEIGK